MQEVKWANGLQNILQNKDFEVTGYDSENKVPGKDIINQNH